MEHLRAPWRDAYIRGLVKRVPGCLFCRLLNERKDRKNLIFLKSAHSFAVLNRFPYNNGHVLVVPLRHVKEPDQLTLAESADLWDLLCHTKKMLAEAFHPHGYNIGMNLGKVSGAGEPGHLHFHIVPRWRGDVNFMPVVSQTKVLSQSLAVTYDCLIRAQQKISFRKKTREQTKKR